MLTVFCLSLLGFLSVWGTGILASRTFLVGLRCPGEAALLGLICISVIGTCLNFFFPLTQTLTTGMLFVGLGALYHHRKRAAISLGGFGMWNLAGLLVGFSYVATTNRPYADTAIYHLPTLQWLWSEPTPIGIVNLFFPLAYNSQWHVAASMFRLPYFGISGSFVTNVILCIAFVHFAVSTSRKEIARIRRQRNRLRLSNAFIFVSTPVIFTTSMFILNWSIGNPDSDFAVLVYGVCSIYFLIRLLERGISHNQLFLAVIFGCYAATIKLTAALLPVTLLVLISFRVNDLRKNGRESLGTAPVKRKVSMALLLTVGPWIIKNILLSGCLVFPIKATCFPNQPFSPTKEILRAQEDDLVWHNIGPKFVGGAFSLSDRLLNNAPRAISTLHVQLMLLLTIVAIYLSIGSILGRSDRSEIVFRADRIFLMLLPAHLVGQFIWLTMAPAHRLGYLWNYSALILSIALCIVHLRYFHSALTRLGSFVSLSLLPALIIVHFRSWNQSTGLHPWPAIPSRWTEPRTSNSGLPYHGPNVPWHCWDLPVICAEKRLMAPNLTWHKGMGERTIFVRGE